MVLFFCPSLASTDWPHFPSLPPSGSPCRYVIPTWQDEQDVRSGKKVGTMWGIMDAEEAKHVKPEGHKKPHYKKEDGERSSASLEEEEDGAVQLPLKRAQQVLLGSRQEA